MPFVPLTPADLKALEKQCDHPKHGPPRMAFIRARKPRKWVCPSCGAATLIEPARVRYTLAG